jgi:hypothetical protein
VYARKVIDARLKALAEKLKFEPEYHSIDKVIRANAHFASLMDTETGAPKRKFKSDEILWIKNERAICQVDFRYWATRYGYIKDKENRLVRYVPNVAQEIIMDIAAELEEEGRAIAMMYLKARQLGVTTWTELAVAHRVQFIPQVNAVAGSSDPDKSRLMAQMMELCWKYQPSWLMPTCTKHVDGELIEFGAQNSAVSIQHGTQFTGIARGTTPTVAHLSEVADFDNPKKLIDASLIKAMHESPWMFLVLESTANGRRNYWHETWEASKEGWKDRTSKLCPVFLPWFVGKDIYPTTTWMHARPIPESWQPKDMTVAHARRAAEYVASSDYLRKHLGSNWKMPRHQMWFWEIERAQAERKNALQDFYAEMPADDTEAFQSKNTSVFSIETISEYRENTKTPLAVYAVVNPDIPERLRPAARDIDRTKKIISMSAPMPNGDRFTAELVPLKFKGYSTFDYNNKLLIYEWPQKEREYGLGIDTADGIHKDNTVIEVVRKGDLENNDGQVAEWASGLVGAYDLAPIAYAIGLLFTVQVGEEYQQPKVVIECNRNGEACQLEMRKMGWRKFHIWQRYDNKKLNAKRSNKIGWFTTSWSRTMCLDLIVKLLRDDLADIGSPMFVDEMQDLEATEENQRLEAAYGGKDDRIMAIAIVLFSLHVLELNGTQRNLMRERLAERSKEEVFPVYSPPAQDRELDDGDPMQSSALIQVEEDYEAPELSYTDHQRR